MGANLNQCTQQQSHEIQFATDCTITAALMGNVTVTLHSLTIPKSLFFVFFCFGITPETNHQLLY